MKGQFIAVIAICILSACGPADDSRRIVGQLASDRIELTAEFSEPVVEILVAEGDAVESGQVLLLQNDARALARLAEAEAIVLQSQARLDELVRGPRTEQIAASRATVEGATRDLEFRRSELARIREIHQLGLASPDALDKASAANDAAEAELKRRLAQLSELLTGTTVEELAQAEQAVKQAQARRDAAQIDVNRHRLIAPVAGIVDSRLFEVGERPGVGQPVLVVLGGQQPHARVYVPESLRVLIRTGTVARIHVDGLDAPVSGKVRWVASESAFTPYFALTERDRGRLSYVAKIDVTEDRERLPDGIPVDVEFELD